MIGLGLLGFAMPWLGSRFYFAPEVSGAFAGALVAGAATLGGVLLQGWITRRQAREADEAARAKVKSLIVSELVVIANRLITIQRHVDNTLCGVESDAPGSMGGVDMGKFRPEILRGMPRTDAMGAELLRLSKEEIAAFVNFRLALDQTLSDMRYFLREDGETRYFDAKFVQASLNDLRTELIKLFEIIAPDQTLKSRKGGHRRAVEVLRELAQQTAPS